MRNEYGRKEGERDENVVDNPVPDKLQMSETTKTSSIVIYLLDETEVNLIEVP
jgi:hypothetical protein